MGQGYDDFFKAARQSKAPNAPPSTKPEFKIQKPKANPQAKKAGSDDRVAPRQRSFSENEIRAQMKAPAKNKKSSFASKIPPFKASLLLAVLFGVLGFGYAQPEQVESWLQRIEILPMPIASAADEKAATAIPANGPKAAAEKSASKSEASANTAQTSEKGNSAVCIQPNEMSDEDLSHFKRLSERNKELDQREQELNALEEELHKQRDEVEARIVKLESIRGDISTVLKDRVEVDEERVKTLVEFYSNMKPKQAADIVANLNEDLAVEVLGKMKKKNAAEIMNLLPPEKARTISEKFTGYKRR